VGKEEANQKRKCALTVSGALRSNSRARLASLIAA
jgi:hypothetical protein